MVSTLEGHPDDGLLRCLKCGARKVRKQVLDDGTVKHRCRQCGSGWSFKRLDGSEASKLVGRKERTQPTNIDDEVKELNDAS
jgi:hypothetical protein